MVAIIAPGCGALIYSGKLQNPSQVPLLVSHRRLNFSLSGSVKPVSCVGDSSGSVTTRPTSSSPDDENSNGVEFVGQEKIPLEGVIQFEKPNSPSLIDKWGRVALLACSDVLALLLFSAIGRFSHGFPVFELGTLQTADPFIAGWLFSAYMLGGYGEDGQGKNGKAAAITTAAKSWALGIPLGMIIRSVSKGELPQTGFIFVTMGSTAVVVIGLRAFLLSFWDSNKTVNSDDYKQGSPFELFELLTSLVRRW